MTVSQAIPDVPDGAPPWVYVVAVAAAVIVAGITGAPSIIEKWRAPRQSTKDDKPEPAALTQTQPHPPVLSAVASADTDTLRSMIADLQRRLDKSETRANELQERVVTLTGELATARGEISSLRSQVQVLSMDRRGG